METPTTETKTLPLNTASDLQNVCNEILAAIWQTVSGRPLNALDAIEVKCLIETVRIHFDTASEAIAQIARILNDNPPFNESKNNGKATS